MVDAETDRFRVLGRVMWRRRPVYLAVVLFFRKHKGTMILRLGRRLRA